MVVVYSKDEAEPWRKLGTPATNKKKVNRGAHMEGKKHVKTYTLR